MYDSLDSVDQSTSGLKLEEENRLRISEDFDYKQDKYDSFSRMNTSPVF